MGRSKLDPRSDLQLPLDHFLPGFLATLRKATTTYSNWLQQALAEPTKPRTEDHPIYGSHSPEHFDNLATQFIGMIANGDKDMANTPKIGNMQRTTSLS
jgi:hypothetical protein